MAATDGDDGVTHPIDQLYSKLVSLFGNSSQLFCMEFPGRVLDETTYAFKTDSIYSILTKPQPVLEEEFRLTDDLFDVGRITGGPTGRKLAETYEMVLNLLVPKYLALKDFDTDKAAMRKWLLEQVDWTEARSDGTLVKITGSRMDLYQQLLMKYLMAKNAWEDDKNTWLADAERAPDRGQALEDFAKKLANQVPVREAELERLFGDAVVRGYYHEIREMLSYLDIKSEGEIIEEAKARLRDTGMSSLDESETVYPVQLQPTDWFQALSTDFKSEDLLLDPEFLQAKLIQRTKDLEQLQAQYESLKTSHTGDEKDLGEQVQAAQDAYDRAQSDQVKQFSSVTITLAQMYFANKKATDPSDLGKFNTELSNNGSSDGPLTDQQWQQLQTMQNATIDAQRTLMSTSRALAQLEAQQAAATATDAAQALITLQQQIQDMQADVDQLKATVMSQYGVGVGDAIFSLSTAAAGQLVPAKLNSDQHAALANVLDRTYNNKQDFESAVAEAFAAYTPTLPPPTSQNLTDLESVAQQPGNQRPVPSAMPPAGRWFDVIMNFKASTSRKGSTVASGSSHTSWSVDVLFGSAGGSSDTSWSNFTQSYSAKNSSFDLGFRATKVTIDRGGWFTPDLFTVSSHMVRLDSDPNDLTATKPISFAPPKFSSGAPTAADDTTLATLNTAIFPAYPIAFIIAKDVTLKIAMSKQDQSYAKSVLNQSSSIGGGFLCFSASSSSTSSSTSESYYTGSSDSQLIIRIPGPQILGWFLEFVPESDHSPAYTPMPDNYLPKDDHSTAFLPHAVSRPLALDASVLPPAGLVGGDREADVPDSTSVTTALMLGPTPTGNVVVLTGHGAMDVNTFNFQRAAGHACNLYSYVFQGSSIYQQAYAVEQKALDTGAIPDGWAGVSSSRIGGTLIKDMILSAPINPPFQYYTPAAFNHTTIVVANVSGGNSQVDAYFNGANAVTSTRIQLIVHPGQADVRVSSIIGHPTFAGRGFDVLWAACKV